jgi:hypothetical protein
MTQNFRPRPVNLVCRVETAIEFVKQDMKQGMKLCAFNHAAELRELANELLNELEKAYKEEAGGSRIR